MGSPATQRKRTAAAREAYLYFGATAKYRLYNAMLQGQFRDSTVQFERGDLRPGVLEFWIGGTYEFRPGWRITAFARTRTAELDLGAKSRRPVWGGFVVSCSY